MEQRVRLTLMSHCSDEQEQPNPNRMNWIKWLLMKYSNTNEFHDPDKDYEEFITKHPRWKINQ